jgi:hypothetical protein
MIRKRHVYLASPYTIKGCSTGSKEEEDAYEFRCHLNATKYRRTLAEIYYRLRNIYKHGERMKMKIITIVWIILFVPVFYYGFHEIDKEFKDEKNYNYRFYFLTIWGVIMLFLIILFFLDITLII